MKKVLIVIIALWSFTGPVRAQNADINLLRSINLYRNRSLDNAFAGITNSAAPAAVAVPVGLFVAGLIKKDSSLEWNAIGTAASVVVATGITEALKYTVKRPRPYVTYPDIQNKLVESDPSFPSGHSSAAFAIATSLSLDYPEWYVIAPSYLWASAVAYSRMDLGVHYPSDVLAGMVIGAGSAYLGHKGQQWLNRWYDKKHRKKPVHISNL